MSAPRPAPRRNDRRIAVLCGALVAGMTGLSFAAVPLYELFCKTTGWAGTTMVASAPASNLGTRDVTVRFDANVIGGLGWRFQPEEESVKLRTGAVKTVTYLLRNDSAQDSTGIASFNVSPELAGGYFNKIQCFCFTEQTLKAGEQREETVVFFVDPAAEKDPQFARLETITLSYTFFPAKKRSLAATAGAPDKF